MEELQHIGLNQATISSLGVMVFGVIGALGQWHQVALIWRTRSVRAVSVRWTLVFSAMFLSYVVYGLHTDKAVLMFQGGVRIAFYPPVLAGIYAFGAEKSSAVDKVWCGALTAAVIAMLAMPAHSGLFFQFFGYLGVAMTLDQPYRIWKNRSTGAVSMVMLLTFSLGSVFWLWYAWVFGDTRLFWLAFSFLVVYAVTMLVWMAYRPRRVTPHQLC